MKQLLEIVRGARVYDLAQPYFTGMPHHPAHPPFLFSLSKQHGDLTTPGGASSAAEAITLGGHVGTHIDAICHFSCGGKLHGGYEAAQLQSYAGGISQWPVDGVAPILRRGVLMDIAGQAGVEELAEDFSIAPGHLEEACRRQGVDIEAGDVVLLRTGWARRWEDAPRYINQARGPGPELDAARWLSSRKIFAAGSDTIAFEKVPAADMPVHVHLLVENGIHIVEALNMDQLARERVYEFLFVAAPLKIRGGTGSPIRPFAVAATT